MKAWKNQFSGLVNHNSWGPVSCVFIIMVIFGTFEWNLPIHISSMALSVSWNFGFTHFWLHPCTPQNSFGWKQSLILWNKKGPNKQCCSKAYPHHLQMQVWGTNVTSALPKSLCFFRHVQCRVYMWLYFFTLQKMKTGMKRGEWRDDLKKKSCLSVIIFMLLMQRRWMTKNRDEIQTKIYLSYS